MIAPYFGAYQCSSTKDLPMPESIDDLTYMIVVLYGSIKEKDLTIYLDATKRMLVVPSRTAKDRRKVAGMDVSRERRSKTKGKPSQGRLLSGILRWTENLTPHRLPCARAVDQANRPDEAWLVTLVWFGPLTRTFRFVLRHQCEVESRTITWEVFHREVTWPLACSSLVALERPYELIPPQGTTGATGNLVVRYNPYSRPLPESIIVLEAYLSGVGKGAVRVCAVGPKGCGKSTAAAKLKEALPKLFIMDSDDYWNEVDFKSSVLGKDLSQQREIYQEHLRSGFPTWIAECAASQNFVLMFCHSVCEFYHTTNDKMPSQMFPIRIMPIFDADQVVEFRSRDPVYEGIQTNLASLSQTRFLFHSMTLGALVDVLLRCLPPMVEALEGE